MVRISLGLAYHRTQAQPGADWDELRQVTTSMGLVATANFVRPWFDFGLGYYEEERVYSGGLDFTERTAASSFTLIEKTFGYIWGGGVGFHLSESVGIEVGGRFHGAFTNLGGGDPLQLLSLQAGLSYAIR